MLTRRMLTPSQESLVEKIAAEYWDSTLKHIVYDGTPEQVAKAKKLLRIRVKSRKREIFGNPILAAILTELAVWFAMKLLKKWIDKRFSGVA